MTGPAGGLGPAELARVAEWLGSEAGGGVAIEGELTARLIAGGKSNLTFALGDQSGERRWVLRRPPLGGYTPSAHDVGREFRVTRALEGAGVAVPPTVASCTDESVLGAPFTVVEFVEGVAVARRSDLEGIDRSALDAVVEGLVEALARLHDVDHVAVGLEGFGRPDGYAARQLRRWSGQWEHLKQHHEPTVDALATRVADRLGAGLPVQERTSVVHGDYRIDNTLLAYDGAHDGTGAPTGSVAAIVDWELSTIGDPVADVALMAIYRDPALDLILGFDAAWTSQRLPDAAGLAAAYERTGGALPHWETHLGLAAYKLAVIAAGIDHRYRSGGTVGDGFDTAGQAVAPLLERALRQLG
ncbi:phosphotransferase family protein [Nocardioides zeae]|uniref:Phosphotransferase family protein n=1 Tax=Nocardioides imazamoxiresistens TaxID=3231893 RepID=A0ABU3PSH7_9ACTN|nr:phosphotransferase family protein [Nocardioides zeae]MDT9592180.1 phosphotransferase family protein [Nocardioides zeae]